MKKYRKRDIQLNFRVSAEERRAIEEKMAMLQTTNMAAYIRKMSVDGYIVHLDTTDIRELVSQMRRYNNNLNQIAKRINETRNIYKADMDEIRQQQDTIWSMVYKLVDTLTGIR